MWQTYKKFYYIVGDNFNRKYNCYTTFWIDSIILDTNSDYYNEYKSSYCDTIDEAKDKLNLRIKQTIKNIDDKINELENIKKQLNNSIKYYD